MVNRMIDVAERAGVSVATVSHFLNKTRYISPETQQRVLEVIQELNRAVVGTPEAQQARDQLVRMSDSIRTAAERAGDELRPELVSMLRQANAELRRRSHLDE